MPSSPDTRAELEAQEHMSSSDKKAELEAHDEDMLKYLTIDGLMASVIEGSIKPQSGRYLVKLARGHRAWLGEVLFEPSMACPDWSSLQKDCFFVACFAVFHKIRRWTVGEEEDRRGVLHPEHRSPQRHHQRRQKSVEFIALSYRWISAGEVEGSAESYMT